MVTSTVTLNAQKKHADKYADINYEKVAYVAKEKTEKLDKIVRLDKKKQEKKVYNIYEKHEVRVQKLRRDIKIDKKIKYKKKQNRVRHVYQEYEAKKEKEQFENLKKQVVSNIVKILNNRQLKALAAHEESELQRIIQ